SLIFEAALPATGVLVCPLCNSAFAAQPPAGPAPTTATPQPSPPIASGRHVLRGVLVVGAVFILGCGLWYAYYLMSGLDHKAAAVPVPSASIPGPPEPDKSEIVLAPPIRSELAPRVTFLKPKLPDRLHKPQPVAVPEQEPLSLALPERVNRAIDRGVA